MRIPVSIALVLAAGSVGAPGKGPAPGESQSAHYVDTSLELDGQLLSWAFVDFEGDGSQELVLAVLTPAGERELHLHRTRPARVEPEPYRRIPILTDILAWTCAEVRAEPGKELVFLTRGGAWSYSPTLDGYRGNVRPLVESEMIYDLPDPRALPHWSYVLPAAGGGGDTLLLPGRDGYGVWGPVPGDEPRGDRYALLADFSREGIRVIEASARPDRRANGSRVQIGVDAGGLGGPFALEDLRGEAALLADAHRYRAPALVDVDGDGDLDLVAWREGALALHLGRGDGAGPGEEPTRIEALPAYLGEDENLLELVLADVDGDGDLDLVAKVEEDAGGFENAPVKVLVLRNDGQRLLPAKPSQVLRFQAADLRLSVADVNGDRRPDLVLRKLELPSLLGTVTGLEFTFTHLIYLGERRGFARKPSLRQVETYDEETISAVVANRDLSMDCDGDGIADLVEVDLHGRVAIRRLVKSSGVFSGDSWKLERTPWKAFDAGGSILSLRVEDLNGDGLGDVVSAGAQRLTILFSQRPGRHRR